jgi:hypothetical protein
MHRMLLLLCIKGIITIGVLIHVHVGLILLECRLCQLGGHNLSVLLL